MKARSVHSKRLRLGDKELAMTDMNLITNPPRNFQMRSDFQSLVNANMKSDFFEGDDYVFKPNLNSVEQGKSVLDHYETKLKYEKVATPEELAGTPEKLKDRVWQQLNTPIDVLLQSSMPAGLSDQQQAEWISNIIRSSDRESNSSSDKYNAAMSSLSKSVIEDGRPHITGIYDLINNINKNYQKNFGEITKNATKFMESFNKTLGLMSTYIEAGKDGKIRFKKIEFLTAFRKGMEDYIKNSAVWGFILPIEPSSINANNIDQYANPIASLDDAPGTLDFFKKKLEGQGFFVSKVIDTKTGKFKINIYPDLRPLLEVYISVSFVQLDNNKDLMSQAFQSLQTSIDTQKNAVNNSVSRLLETFRQDNSHFETLTQLLIQLLKDLFQYNAGFANT